MSRSLPVPVPIARNNYPRNQRNDLSEPETEYSKVQPQAAIEDIRRMDASIFSVGEVELKGADVRKNLSILYPAELARRRDWRTADPSASSSRVQSSLAQMRELGDGWRSSRPPGCSGCYQNRKATYRSFLQGPSSANPPPLWYKFMATSICCCPGLAGDENHEGDIAFERMCLPETESSLNKDVVGVSRMRGV